MLIKIKNLFLKPIFSGGLVATALMVASCSSQWPQRQSPQSSSPASSPPESLAVPSAREPSTSLQGDTLTAVVTTVEANSGASGAYTFAVTIQSPDTGCDQYADWWEVLSEDGELIYRRILAHSHVNEQPFRRTGGPVTILPNQPVIVRAHMHSQGYGTQAMQGTVDRGFTAITLPEGFADNLAQVAPLPNGCAF